MTNEELAARVKNGEPWALLELWKAVHRFVEMKARQYITLAGAGSKAEYEDLVQDGFLAMLDAVNEFDPERGSSFIGYLVWTLQKRFAQEGGHRSSKRDMLQFAGSMDEPLTADDPDGGTLGDLQEDPTWEYAFCLVDYREYVHYVRRLLKTAMLSLTPRSRYCIEKYYFDGLTLEEISGNEHSREGPRKAIERGLKYLRRGKYNRNLRAALQGFADFDELNAEGRKRLELKAIANTHPHR